MRADARVLAPCQLVVLVGIGNVPAIGGDFLLPVVRRIAGDPVGAVLPPVVRLTLLALRWASLMA